MVTISAAAVASLRARTGVSILECKKALEEAGGDEELAIEILRKRGEAQAVKKADRMQGEGFVFAAQSGNKVAMVLLRCETDFVARNEGFQKLGKEMAELALAKGEGAADEISQKLTSAVQQLGENITLGELKVVEGKVTGTYVHSNGKIGVVVAMDGGSAEAAKDAAMHAAAMSPTYISPEEVTAEAVAKEKEIWTEQLTKEGKPAAIQEKIMLGKEKKFREENALLTQPFVKDPSKTVRDSLGGANVTAYVRLSVR
jgi:elongation factor Ts